MEEINYEIDFVKRTKKIIEDYHDKGDYKLTLLINCLVGLIVFPSERQENIPTELLNKNIEGISAISALRINIFNPAKKNGGKTVGAFIKKMRNGIAHQNIEPINDNGKFVGVIIRNKRGNTIDFEVELRRRELQQLAFFIADLYLGYRDNQFDESLNSKN